MSKCTFGPCGSRGLSPALASLGLFDRVRVERRAVADTEVQRGRKGLSDRDLPYARGPRQPAFDHPGAVDDGAERPVDRTAAGEVLAVRAHQIELTKPPDRGDGGIAPQGCELLRPLPGRRRVPRRPIGSTLRKRSSEVEVCRAPAAAASTTAPAMPISRVTTTRPRHCRRNAVRATRTRAVIASAARRPTVRLPDPSMSIPCAIQSAVAHELALGRCIVHGSASDHRGNRRPGTCAGPRSPVRSSAVRN